MRAKKRKLGPMQKRLKEFTQWKLEQLLARLPHDGLIEIRWKNIPDTNGQVELDKKGDILIIYLSPNLLFPTEETCRQALAHVLFHELGHGLDWNAYKSVESRRPHDEHYGIELARVIRAENLE